MLKHTIFIFTANLSAFVSSSLYILAYFLWYFGNQLNIPSVGDGFGGFLFPRLFRGQFHKCQDLWYNYNSRCRNKLVSSIHTSFPYNTQPLPQSSDRLPKLDLDYPIVNRDEFFGCFHYDCCTITIPVFSRSWWYQESFLVVSTAGALVVVTV